MPESARQTDRPSCEVSATLAHFVANTQWHDLPIGVRSEAKRSLLNYFAVALAGCSDATIQRADLALAPFGGMASASVIGHGWRRDMLHAASLNAMAANVFDFDDTHPPTIIHPTAPIAPVLFALAESLATAGAQTGTSRLARLSGQDLLLAFVLGVEVACRIGNAVSPEHYARGWHITSTCGVFGAAMATGKGLALDAAALHGALGNASAQASGLVETLGTMAKSLGVGNAARNGMVSALLARQGFAGPAEPLAGVHGFLNVTGKNPRLAMITDGLGAEWEILRNTYKPYPCGVVLNPVIEACLALAAKRTFTPQDIESIELTGAPLLRLRTDRPAVTTGRLAQVSAQHAVAVALLQGQAGLAQFTDQAVCDPATRALGAKLHFVVDERYALDAARIVIMLRDGTRAEQTIEHARGSEHQALSDQDLRDKLRKLAQYGGSGVAPEPLMAALHALDQAPDAAHLMHLACAPGPTKN